MKIHKTCILFLVGLTPQVSQSQSIASLGEVAELPSHRALISQSMDAPLSPFTTDGCSGGMSGIWAATAAKFPDWAENLGESPPWEACCVAHDILYHNASGQDDPKLSYAARVKADGDLRSCVLSQGARDRETLALEYAIPPQAVDFLYNGIAQGMYFAVRLGGAPCSGLPWRWGYGFANCSLLGDGAQEISPLGEPVNKP